MKGLGGFYAGARAENRPLPSARRLAGATAESYIAPNKVAQEKDGDAALAQQQRRQGRRAQ